MDLTIYNGDVHESVAKNILRLLSNYFAIILSCPVTSIPSIKPFSYVGKVPDDQGFYCFPTVPDFAD